MTRSWKSSLLVVALGLCLVACESGQGSAAAESQPTAAPAASGLEPGDLALDYLTEGRYSSLLIEVDYVEGQEPSFDALTALVESLGRTVRKSQGIELDVADEAIPADLASSIYDRDALSLLELDYRDHGLSDPKNPGQAVIWVVYLNGDSARSLDQPRSTFGLAFGGSEIALFKERLTEASPEEVREAAEKAVLLHEVGHLLGLVNNAIPMVADHESLEHAFHDQDPFCLMYSCLDVLDRGPEDLAELDFCTACRADLTAAGGKSEPTFSLRDKVNAGFRRVSPR